MKNQSKELQQEREIIIVIISSGGVVNVLNINSFISHGKNFMEKFRNWKGKEKKEEKKERKQEQGRRGKKLPYFFIYTNHYYLDTYIFFSCFVLFLLLEYFAETGEGIDRKVVSEKEDVAVEEKCEYSKADEFQKKLRKKSRNHQRRNQSMST